MRKEAYIDRIFRRYGENFFGKEGMDLITSDQVEEARCAAFASLSELTREYGKQDEGTVRDLFVNYIFEHFV